LLVGSVRSEGRSYKTLKISDPVLLREIVTGKPAAIIAADHRVPSLAWEKRTISFVGKNATSSFHEY
jgi:hypothetical protein